MMPGFRIPKGSNTPLTRASSDVGFISWVSECHALAVGSEQKWDQQGARLAKIEAGMLTVERDQVLRTTYKLRNGSPR